MNNPLRVLVVDDEQLARDELCYQLGNIGDIEVVSQVGNGVEAVAAVERLDPDVVFLDVQMPGLTGFEVARRLLDRDEDPPAIVFVTAFDQHAIEAFEVNAVDYLLKPVERSRLRETVNRAQERLDRAESREEAAARLAAAAEDYQAAARPPALERIPVRHQDEIVILPVKEVASIVADGELLHLTTARNETYTLSYRLKDLEARLNPAHFVRLGRGTLANVEMMRRVSPMPGGTYIVTLNNGQQLNVSRSQGRILREHLLKL
jgi:DNA-binding LytR/AlgR family response regulator